MYRILAAVLTALLMQGSVVQATPSLASLDIVPKDLPKVVRLVKTWNLTPALADYINVLQPGTSAKQGIVVGHAEFYECKAPAVCVVSTEVYQLRTKAAAHAWYQIAIVGSRDTLLLPRFGDERFGQIEMGPKFPISAIIFRSGQYAARIMVQSPTKIVSVRKIIQLASIINRHIRRAH